MSRGVVSRLKTRIAELEDEVVTLRAELDSVRSSLAKRDAKIEFLTNKSSSQNTTSEIIANNDDLLIQILQKLPIKPLTKFKSVSKHWLSLISDPQFSRRLISTSVSGLFMSSTLTRGYDFINLKQTSNSSEAPIQSVIFKNNPVVASVIVHSCNGLLLCSGNMDLDTKHNYVCNPTTRKYALLPPLLPLRPVTVSGLQLAFDPSKSPHFKVVCVWSYSDMWNHFHIEVYSSETGTWKFSGDSFHATDDLYFDEGVFWNGALHWLSMYEEVSSLYFNVDEERLSQLPMPPVQDPEYYNLFSYFGESCGHLHLIYELCNPSTIQFDVYEMKMDYSGWFVKFRIDCSEFPTAFPEIIPTLFGQLSLDLDLFSIVYVVRGDVDEESYAVIRIPGNVIRYNFKSKAFDILCNTFAGPEAEISVILPKWSDTHQYIESVAVV